MTDRIEMHPRIDLDQALREGPSLAERATQVAIKALGTNPSHHGPAEAFYLRQAWDNLKSSLAGFSTYGIMHEIEISLDPQPIQLEHFKKLAHQLNFDIEELPVDQLPLGIYSFAHLAENAATREFWTALGTILELPELTKLDEIRAWLDDPKNAQELNKVEKLSLSGLGLKVLPPPLAKLTQLKILFLSRNELNYIPNWLGTSLTQLEHLSLGDNLFYEIPGSINQFTNLQMLVMDNNPINAISKEVLSLNKLEHLHLYGTQISKIPDEIEKLSNLKTLALAGSQITEVPKTIGALTQLEKLDLSENQIRQLPKEMARLNKLNTLLLSSNKITEIPSVIGLIDNLTDLQLSNNEISELPDEICNLPTLEELNLSNNQIAEVPEHLGPSLRTLDLQGNQLEVLPGCWHNPGQLNSLDLSNNPLKDIPEGLPRLGEKGDMHYRL